ncbi:unnamed protein product [Protopolystoma xenopodis]|uniref:Uncharacterized protein n=1 Tax=Protopolystoma xenopodis TaxID=117903 RepID=A0A448X1C2_9PLAT|nr:unnamed protein product [Protopolystoma xenopodis]
MDGSNADHMATGCDTGYYTPHYAEMTGPNGQNIYSTGGGSGPYSGTGSGNTNFIGGGVYGDEDSGVSCGLDSSDLIDALGGPQAISMLSDQQLEDLGRTQFTFVNPQADNEMATTSMNLIVEEDDRSLDETEILRVTGAKSLESVRTLCVPCSGYTSIDAEALCRCLNLRHLDLSENALRIFPRRLHLPRLTQLGLTGNRFIHLPLIEQFPQLTRLTLDERMKQLLNPQMLAYFCPRLKTINDQLFDEVSTDFTLRIVQEARGIIEPHIRSKWESEFADRYHTVRGIGQRRHLIESMVKHLKERNLLMDETISKYKDLMLYRFVEDYLRSKLFEHSNGMRDESSDMDRYKMYYEGLSKDDSSDFDEDEEAEAEARAAGMCDYAF